MDSDTRRGFIRRSSQIGVAAVLGGVAGCLGGGKDSNNSSPEYIENISFGDSKMMINPTKKAIGKTYQLLTPSGNESVWSETVSGDQTRVQMITRYLVDQEYPSGNYTLQVVNGTEVVSERSIKLAPDVKVQNVGDFHTDSGFPPYLDVKLVNQGTLTARVEFDIPSGVPSPPGKGGLLTVNRIDENKSMYRNGIEPGEIAKFELGPSRLFMMATEKELYNYTVGNSSIDSRKCDGKDRKAPLIIDVTNGGKMEISFQYTLSGDVKRQGMEFYCTNVSFDS